MGEVTLEVLDVPCKALFEAICEVPSEDVVGKVTFGEELDEP